MPWDVDANNLFFEIEFFDFTERFDVINFWLWHWGARTLAEKTRLSTLFVLLSFHRIFDCFFDQTCVTVMGINILPPMDIFKAIKSPGESKAFICFFIHWTLIHSFGEIKNVSERTIVIAFLNDGFNGRFAGTLDRSQSKPDFSLFVYCEVHAGFIYVRPQNIKT